VVNTAICSLNPDISWFLLSISLPCNETNLDLAMNHPIRNPKARPDKMYIAVSMIPEFQDNKFSQHYFILVNVIGSFTRLKKKKKLFKLRRKSVARF
jgi:hypothetical protein